jgi:hypothetical protein
MALFTLRAASDVRAPQFGSAEGDLDAEMVAIAPQHFPSVARAHARARLPEIKGRGRPIRSSGGRSIG